MDNNDINNLTDIIENNIDTRKDFLKIKNDVKTIILNERKKINRRIYFINALCKFFSILMITSIILLLITLLFKEEDLNYKINFIVFFSIIGGLSLLILIIMKVFIKFKKR